jgi:parallel beta-helix repeat protein
MGKRMGQKRHVKRLNYRLFLEELEPREVMNTYFVSPTGLDSNVGSSAAPWLTLQHAANLAKAGDKVNVEPGTFDGFTQSTNGTAVSPITFQKDPNATLPVLIQGIAGPVGNTNRAIQESGAYVILNGFQVANAPGTGILIGGPNCVVENCTVFNNGFGLPSTQYGGDGILTGQLANNVLIENNETYQNREHGIYIGGGGDNPVIIGNRIHDNGDATQTLVGGNGIQINADGPYWPTVEAVIENNIIYANLGNGISLQGAQSSLIENNLVVNNFNPIGISISKGSINDVFMDNTVVSDVGTGSIRKAVEIGGSGSSQPANTGNTFFNNILEALQGVSFAYQDANPPAASDDNILWNGDASKPVALDESTFTKFSLAQWQAMGFDLHSQAAAPMFVDPTTLNYHLQSTSPAIGKAVASFGGVSVLATDLDGNARPFTGPSPLGTHYDIGTYEYTGAVTTGVGGGGTGGTGNVGTATHFSVTAPASTTAGSAFSITITALDSSNNIATNYTGSVHFSSSDTLASLPANYAFTTTDAGVHTFNTIILRTAGTQTVTATDLTSSTITGKASSLPVNPAAASQFRVSGFPSPTTAGVANNLTATALDPFGNRATGYRGTINFTSTDSKAVLPTNYAFTSTDAGVHTFSATLKIAATQSLTATDTATSTITGSQLGIIVNPAAKNYLVISRFPSTTTAGVAQTFRVTAQDLYGNTATSYNGTVTFSTTDSQALVPLNYAFTTVDAGSHAFFATMNTAGTQSLTVKDLANTAVASNTFSGITVTPAAPTKFLVTGFTLSVTAGNAGSFVVTAKDAFGNTTSAYLGTVRFSSTDTQASLPGNYTFTSTDAGTHAFSATLKTVGTQSIIATDTVNAAITGIESGISVVAGQATTSSSSGTGTAGGASFDLVGFAMTPQEVNGQHIMTNGQWWVAKSNGSNSFSNNMWATWNPLVQWVDVQTGDFNGDGKKDIIGRDLQTGNWWVGISTGSSFVTSLWATWNPNVTWVDVKVGDFNGDGKTDITGRWLQAGSWWTGISSGSSFATTQWGSWNPNVTWVDVNAGDFNGDGKTDLTGRYLQGGSWWTAVSSGSSFNTAQWGSWNPAATWVDVKVGDFNGDGKADIVGRVSQNGQWYVDQSTGAAFTLDTWTVWSTGMTWSNVMVGDFNGDGKDDIVGRVSQNGQWWVGLSTGSSFTNSLFTTWSTAVTWTSVMVGDYNGDRKADIVGRLSQNGQWWVGLSTGSQFINNCWTTWSTAVVWASVKTGNFS